jgi:aspartyl-tRNA(Asn)/glutamyl-tRNA(Gln) amidotransferase subunit B
MQIIQGNTGEWEVVIGLEVHAQVFSHSKLFSGAPAQGACEPNSCVALVDVAFPGMLPVLNRVCVEQAVRTGIGLNAEINRTSMFDRKNYFYADLPQGYQISQLYTPIIGRGWLDIMLEDGSLKRITINRLHLEQDAGKSIHDQSPRYSFIDLNRAGIALMEIVSDPDLRSSAEAVAYLKKLRTLLRYLGTCDGDMEKGNLRCDANVSVRRRDTTELGTRCEIKNINSFRNIMRAIDYEAARQVELIEAGNTVMQETRLFDADQGVTRSMRSKENAHDYRYFPDPDLPPLVLTEAFIDAIRANLPELPQQKIDRYTNVLGLTAYDADVLTQEKERAEYFEKVAALADPKLAVNWVTGDLLGRLNKENIELENSPISPERLAGMLCLITDGTISGKIAKQVFELLWESTSDAASLIEQHGLKQVSSSGEIEALIDQILADHPDKVAEYRSGKEKLFGFFIGQIMKLSGGKMNPGMVNDVLKAKLM